jgi:hypothetical protein
LLCQFVLPELPDAPVGFVEEPTHRPHAVLGSAVREFLNP